MNITLYLFLLLWKVTGTHGRVTTLWNHDTRNLHGTFVNFDQMYKSLSARGEIMPLGLSRSPFYNPVSYEAAPLELLSGRKGNTREPVAHGPSKSVLHMPSSRFRNSDQRTDAGFLYQTSELAAGLAQSHTLYSPRKWNSPHLQYDSSHGRHRFFQPLPSLTGDDSLHAIEADYGEAVRSSESNHYQEAIQKPTLAGIYEPQFMKALYKRRLLDPIKHCLGKACSRRIAKSPSQQPQTPPQRPKIPSPRPRSPDKPKADQQSQSPPPKSHHHDGAKETLPVSYGAQFIPSSPKEGSTSYPLGVPKQWISTSSFEPPSISSTSDGGRGNTFPGVADVPHESSWNLPWKLAQGLSNKKTKDRSSHSQASKS